MTRQRCASRHQKTSVASAIGNRHTRWQWHTTVRPPGLDSRLRQAGPGGAPRQVRGHPPGRRRARAPVFLPDTLGSALLGREICDAYHGGGAATRVAARAEVFRGQRRDRQSSRRAAARISRSSTMKMSQPTRFARHAQNTCRSPLNLRFGGSRRKIVGSPSIGQLEMSGSTRSIRFAGSKNNWFDAHVGWATTEGRRRRDPQVAGPRSKKRHVPLNAPCKACETR